jgi:hypothetical protein
VTSEIKHTIELGDILGVEFECKNCKGKIVLPLDTTRGFTDCPLCGEVWLSNGSFEENSIRKLLSIFKGAQSGAMKSTAFSLRIQIAPPLKL